MEAFSTTTKKAAADVDSAIETVFNELDGIFSLKEEQTTALKAFVEKEDVFFRRSVLRHPFPGRDWL